LESPKLGESPEAGIAAAFVATAVFLRVPVSGSDFPDKKEDGALFFLGMNASGTIKV